MTGHLVGPVLLAGDEGRAVLAAIHGENANVLVQDRGAYVRVMVSARCVVSRPAIERQLGRAFCLPGDLERVMPSFEGRFAVDEDGASWEDPA